MLAAGLATRMAGRNKPDLPWPIGGSLIKHQEAMAFEAGFETLTVARSGPESASRVVNVHPQEGLASSLQCGLDAVRTRFGPVAVGVLLADQPFVTVSDVKRVFAAFTGRMPEIHAIRARYQGVAGHPVFFDETWDDVVHALRGDVGLGAVWDRRGDVGWVDVEVVGRPSPSFDIDTDEAYQQALQWLH
ncbi:MAG: nucleotidyltransferase family protein [Sulfobacillus acidophilus]|uniref:Nucleotidyltransferase family protein n=1 Tax=Sulfobacillus acidophilus TaxID=53633 RepID=A0A2T2WJ48_9FIRM|nr:MAG: nucleotidyltransferase family protein [Sulfobacillus acidophilus]